MADENPLILQDNSIAQVLYGENDCNLRALEAELGVEIHARGNRVRIKGPSLERKLARRVLQDLYDLAASGEGIHEPEVRQLVRMASEDASPAVQALNDDDGVIEVGRRKRVIPRTHNQRRYIQAIREHDLVFGTGPGGTGTT